VATQLNSQQAHVVNVQIACDPPQPWGVQGIMPLMQSAGIQHVAEAPYLVQGGYMQAARTGHQAHTSLQGALENRQAAIEMQPEQKQLASLVGGEGQAQVLLGQELGELARGGEFKSGSVARLRRDECDGQWGGGRHSCQL
jgi:hypothetical protein